MDTWSKRTQSNPIYRGGAMAKPERTQFQTPRGLINPRVLKDQQRPYSPPFSARRTPLQVQGYRSISYEGPRWVLATSIGGAKFCGIAQRIIRIELLGVRGYTTTLIGSPGPVRKRGPDLAMVRYSGTPGFQIGRQDPPAAIDVRFVRRSKVWINRRTKEAR
jgi:hypothetical protein